MEEKKVVLSVNDLHVSFKTDEGLVHAVRGVSFDLLKGETLCIVGESGSGKSVTSKTIMGILAASAVIEKGSVIYEGEDLTKIDESEFHRIRGHKIGMVFQDPLSSLNPIMKVGKQITEAMLVNSDLMKRKFDQLISKEEAAYKNIVAIKKTAYQKADLMVDRCDESFEKKIRELQIAIEEASYKASTINPKEDEIDNINAKYEKKILETSDSETRKKLKADKEKELAPFIQEMNEARKAAYAEFLLVKEKNNAEIKELTKQKKIEHSKIIAKAKEMKAEANEKFNFAKPQFKADLDNKKKEAKLEIKKYKEEKKAEYEKDVAEISSKYDQCILEAQTEDEKKSLTSKKKEELALKKKEYKQLFKITKSQAKAEALKVMKEVGIPQPEVRYNQYPFEFSGGMRQRIVIAIALTANPEVLICDEPTTALDVTIQAQILELINRLKKERNMSVIFISHDLGVVANMADRVAVMYAGKIVEVGTASEVFYDPKHPYTWALLSSIPDLDSHEKLEAIPGTPPYLLNPPKGDAFAARNKYALAIDYEKEPPFFKISDTHYAATWLLDKRAPKAEMPRIVSQRIKLSLERNKLDESEGEKHE